jgi:hypothetical protein
MTPAQNWKISFAELSLRARKVLELQSGISYEDALKQVQRLKQTSKVSNAAKKSSQ